MVHENQKKQYTCIHEEQIGRHESDITKLKVRADYKEEKIEKLSIEMHDMDLKLDERMHEMDGKLDKITESIESLKLQSAKDDFDIDNRVKALESKIETLKWVTGSAIGVLSVLVSILALVVTRLH